MPSYDRIKLEQWTKSRVGEQPSPGDKGELLVALVDKVKSLENVVVKSTSYINDDDELVVIPGPWSILKQVGPPRRSTPLIIEGESEDDEEDDDADDESDRLSVGSLSSRSSASQISPFHSRFRSPSTTAPPVSPAVTSRPRNNSNNNPPPVSGEPPKCVIRNEFGHARIQQYILHPERIGAHYHTLLSSSPGEASSLVIPEEELFETGGHVVLSPRVFEKCIANGWGMKHPLAGHFHPITGTEIPPTTMLFRAPRDEAELAIIWKIVVKSYLWIMSQPAVGGGGGGGNE